MRSIFTGRGSQVVRQGSAKPLFASSILAHASKQKIPKNGDFLYFYSSPQTRDSSRELSEWAVEPFRKKRTALESGRNDWATNHPIRTSRLREHRDRRFRRYPHRAGREAHDRGVFRGVELHMQRHRFAALRDNERVIVRGMVRHPGTEDARLPSPADMAVREADVVLRTRSGLHLPLAEHPRATTRSLHVALPNRKTHPLVHRNDFLRRGSRLRAGFAHGDRAPLAANKAKQGAHQGGVLVHANTPGQA